MRDLKSLIFKLICFLIILAFPNGINVNCFIMKPLKKDTNSVASTTVEINGTAFKTDGLIQGQITVAPLASLNVESGGTWRISMDGSREQCAPCLDGIICVPQIQCPAHVRMKLNEKPQICDLPDGNPGFCCVTGQNHTAGRTTLERSPFPPFLPTTVVDDARTRFKEMMHSGSMIPVRKGRPEFLHGIMFHSSPQEHIQNFHQSNMAMQQIIAGQIYSKKEQLPLDDIITNNVPVEFSKSILAHYCTTPRSCPEKNARYRSFDGSCNNPLPRHSLWGSAGAPMQRLLPPSYEDGIWTPRMHSVDGSLLMSARETSRRLLQDNNIPHPKYNLLLMQFGQFLAHDVSQTTSFRLENGDHVQCCTTDGSAILPKEKLHFACLPIPVEKDDEFYREYNVRCMNFVRLSLVPSNDCKIGYGKQRSIVTHYLDASTVYGSSVELATGLRTFNGGKLHMLKDLGHDILPLTDDMKICDTKEPGQTCFKSGDGRTNQIISLVALHIIFAREHNRIADTLAQLNPHYNDERLFQEARRIVIAELQHIVYNEYLPAVIGRKLMKRFRLEPFIHGYAGGYSVEVNAAITTEFSGAAFRMGHSTVDGKLYVHSAYGHVDEIINIFDVMFNPARMRKRSFYDNLLRTMLTQPMQKVDSFISKGLSNFLFRGNHPFGLDLAAFNIQRGREQGLRCYNDYLELMGLRRIRNFHQIPFEISRKLAAVYHHPDDIDLWVGGLLETPMADGIVGQTFAEIIADQFARFKFGDRYFYEYGKSINPGSFSIEQLQEVRKITMARLICDNSDHIHEVPPSAFIRSDFVHNEPVRCNSMKIPKMELAAWRD